MIILIFECLIVRASQGWLTSDRFEFAAYLDSAAFLRNIWNDWNRGGSVDICKSAFVAFISYICTKYQDIKYLYSNIIRNNIKKNFFLNFKKFRIA